MTAVRGDRVPVAVFVTALPSSALIDAVTSVPSVETSITCAADVVIASYSYPIPAPVPLLSLSITVPPLAHSLFPPLAASNRTLALRRLDRRSLVFESFFILPPPLSGHFTVAILKAVYLWCDESRF